jgi:hypothetical protein
MTMYSMFNLCTCVLSLRRSNFRVEYNRLQLYFRAVPTERESCNLIHCFNGKRRERDKCTKGIKKKEKSM